MKYCLSILLVLLLWGCAQVNVLSGGEKDIYAPKIDTVKTPILNGSINFSGDEIILKFDEYILLKNPANNIIITPQLKNKPTITVKNRTFKIVFNEPLTPNTTYNISLNRAIADYNESNDSIFQYVFSTGSYIDSLKIEGSISESFTNKPVKDLIVGLYPVSDTVPFNMVPEKLKPTYITLTKDNGQFEMNYIKNGTYHIFAFTDSDKNLLYNPNSEKIAFSSQHTITLDSNINSMDLRLFKPLDETVKLKAYNLYYPGKLELIFTNPPKDLKVRYKADLLNEKTDRNDSLIYWLTNSYSSSSEFLIKYNNEVDTIRPIMKEIPKKSIIKPFDHTTNLNKGKLLPNDTLTVTFSQPVKSVNNQMIRAYDLDSSLLEIAYIIEQPRQLKIYGTNGFEKYVSIDSGAVVGFNKQQVNKEILLKYDRHEPNYYGKLILQITKETTHPSVIELLDKKGHTVRSFILDAGSSLIEFEGLLPNSYQLRCIEDSNADGKWTTGDLNKDELPEHVFYYESDVKIRSNWDMEIEWVFKK